MRIVVTGSEGYIGTNLCGELRKRGMLVMGLDKVNDGGDLLWDGCEDKIRRYQPDYIIHLAALPAIIACEENKEQATIDNVKTTEIVSKLSLEIGCHTIFASSQAAKSPESSHYAWCKNECEDILNKNNKGYILRFSNVYGGTDYIEKKSSVMAQFVKAYRNNEPLVANGDGKQGRDFIDVRDLVDVIIGLIDTNSYEMITLDVGTGISTPIIDIIKMFDCDYVLNPDSSTVGLESNFANTDMLDELLGYHPEPRMKDWIDELKTI